MREALRSIEGPRAAPGVSDALLTCLALDPAASRLSVANRLTILAVLRREHLLTHEVAETAKALEGRLMLYGADVESELAPSNEELRLSPHGTLKPAWFRFAFAHRDEAAAFLAALSRAVQHGQPFFELYGGSNRPRAPELRLKQLGSPHRVPDI